MGYLLFYAFAQFVGKLDKCLSALFRSCRNFAEFCQSEVGILLYLFFRFLLNIKFLIDFCHGFKFLFILKIGRRKVVKELFPVVFARILEGTEVQIGTSNVDVGLS